VLQKDLGRYSDGTQSAHTIGNRHFQQVCSSKQSKRLYLGNLIRFLGISGVFSFRSVVSWYCAASYNRWRHEPLCSISAWLEVEVGTGDARLRSDVSNECKSPACDTPGCG
jgi:hypothetical protein